MTRRAVHVWFLPSFIAPAALRGGGAVIIDLLRASSTITRALAAGADRVIPCLEPDHALAIRRRLQPQALRPDHIVLGGERGGVLIPGFDLDNSPARFTPAAVRGRTLVFTTTNGTRALAAARDGGASPIIIGCLNNLTRVVERLAALPAVHLVCAGTQGEVSQDDVLCAGAMAAALVDRGFTHASDDQARIAISLWRSARDPAGLLSALRESRGGRNLVGLGFDSDIIDCAALDTSPVVPELDASGDLRLLEQPR